LPGETITYKTALRIADVQESLETFG